MLPVLHPSEPPKETEGVHLFFQGDPSVCHLFLPCTLAVSSNTSPVASEHQNHMRHQM